MSIFTDNVGGSNPPSNSTSGWFEISDLATQSSPILQPTIEGGGVYLTNDQLGLTTDDSFLLDGITNSWDVDSFNFLDSGLLVGDNILARVDLSIIPEIVPQDFSIVYECFDGIDGTGNKIFEFAKVLANTISSAGDVMNIRDETRFHLIPLIINGSCKIKITGTTRFNVTVNTFNFFILRST